VTSLEFPVEKFLVTCRETSIKKRDAQWYDISVGYIPWVGQVKRKIDGRNLKQL
jgi:hypothetical protein